MTIGIEFPGVLNPRSCEITLGHGITPTGGTIEFLPQAYAPDFAGTLRLTDGTRSVSFENVHLDAPYTQRDTNGLQVITCRILDRRWLWQFGEIYGRYNYRDTGNNLTINSEKTPRQLATLLLEAMNEADYDVSQLPNDTRPEVEWIGDNPAAELQELAESLGCHVVLKLDNTVSLLPVGTGADLPTNFVITRAHGFDPAEIPEKLKVITGPYRFQQKFELEAVGKDTDGTIKPIDDLSYTPSGGWSAESPYFLLAGSTDAQARALAKETVWKWYRIVDDFTVVDYSDTDKLRDILPVDDFLVDQDTDADGNYIPKKAFVEGSYWEEYPGKTSPTNTTGTKYKPYFGSWSLDRDRGIVIFSDPVLKIDAGTFIPAELFFTCSFNARNSTNRQTVRYARYRTLTGGIPGTVQIVRRDEIIPTTKQNYDSNGDPTTITDNETAVQDEADYQLDAAQVKYQDVTTDDGEQFGIFSISPDGAIQQVQWSVVVNQGAKTRASRNTEFNWKVPSYEESRRIQETKEFAKAVKAFKKAIKAFP